MACNVFLAGNSEVSLELQCFTAELITYIHSVLVQCPGMARMHLRIVNTVYSVH